MAHERPAALLTKIATLYYTNDPHARGDCRPAGPLPEGRGASSSRPSARGSCKISIHSPLLFSAELEYQLSNASDWPRPSWWSPAQGHRERDQRGDRRGGGRLPCRGASSTATSSASVEQRAAERALRLERTERKKITVVQMNGSLDRSSYSTCAEYIIHRISQAFGGEAQSLVAPMLVDRPEIKDSLRPIWHRGHPGPGPAGRPWRLRRRQRRSSPLQGRLRG